MAPNNRQPGKSVEYYSKSNWQILTQMYGSVWREVLPYCLINVAISAVLQYLKAYKDIDLDISDVSHSFMNMLVAFLLVSRINMSVSRYNDCRSCLGKMCNGIRELLQTMIVLTRKMNDPQDKEWRNETTYRALLLLRTAMAVIDYQSDEKPAWDVDEFGPQEATQVKKEAQSRFRKEPHAGGRTEYDESMRVPPIMAFKLRWCLDTSEDRLSAPMKMYRSESLYNYVNSFMEGYYTCMKLLRTPFPFPLVQMTRTFLLFYIYTVPFAFLSDVSSPIIHLVVVFFLTYGFIGLEIIATELDDPFGEDPNDFNNLAMAQVVVEDAYLMIDLADGEEYVDKLRKDLHRRMSVHSSKTPSTSEESWLLSKP